MRMQQPAEMIDHYIHILQKLYMKAVPDVNDATVDFCVKVQLITSLLPSIWSFIMNWGIPTNLQEAIDWDKNAETPML